MKTCAKCGAEKAVDSFYSDRTSTDGLADRCKDCHVGLMHRTRSTGRKNRTTYMRIAPVLREMRGDEAARPWLERLLAQLPPHVRKEIEA